MGDKGDVPEVNDKETEDKVDEEEKVEPTSSETTAKCSGDTFKYKTGKPILSITFSLSEENPFEVNVGSAMSYKRSDKKAYPVLYEIQDLIDPDREILIKPLKNKACMKNLPNDLAGYMEQLNVVLLDQYNAYYDTTKYDAFVEAQKEFKDREIKKKDNSESKDQSDDNEEKEEEEKVEKVEGEVTVLPTKVEEQKNKIDKLIGILKSEKTENTIDSKYEKYTSDYSASVRSFLEIHKEDVFPLHLLVIKYDNKKIFMTDNGILTDGSKIFPYSKLDMVKNIIGANTFNWTFTTEGDYQKALEILNGKVEDTGYIDTSKIDELGNYKLGGKRKTLSQKPMKHRITKRNHK